METKLIKELLGQELLEVALVPLLVQKLDLVLLLGLVVVVPEVEEASDAWDAGSCS